MENRTGVAIASGWQRGYFFGKLACPRTPCGNAHVVAGEYSDRAEGATEDGLEEDPYQIGLSVLHVLPALPIMNFPARTPISVQQPVLSAASVLLSDPNSGANRMRAGVECLLDARNVRRYPGRSRKNRLTTHARIEAFALSNSEVADLLMAMKWIGNVGSHEIAPLPLAVVLDGIELFARAVHLLYDQTDSELQARAARINRGKGPGKTSRG